jgi:predicted nucleic acid-binding protein
MPDLIVLDSSILIDDLRTGCHADRILALEGVLRNSSVVLAELWRGVLNRADRKLLFDLERDHPTPTPTKNNWLESGQILAKMRDEKAFEQRKLRDLHFDVLIALTARAHGARLITSNRADFELVREYRVFKLEVW